MTANARFGDLQNWELKDWSIKKVIGTGESGTEYDLLYMVTYSNYSTTEQLSLFKPLNGNVKIEGDKIN